jgi:hypothetical protein
LPLLKNWLLKALPCSARALKMLKNWNSTKVVKASVMALAGAHRRLHRPGVDGQRADRHGRAVERDAPQALRGEDGRLLAARRSCMMPGRAGSTPRVMAGGPSMMMLTQRIWIAVKGVAKPRKGAPSTVRMAPMLVESWKRTNLTMLS